MKYNIFTTFLEAKESQEYDHLFQKSFGLATASGIDLALIRELNLHIKNEQGELPLDQYIADNAIVIEHPEIYQLSKKHWEITTAWAIIYKYGENFIYRKDHSDRNYNTIENVNNADLKALNDDGVYIPATDWEEI